jgi:hypothetical protein
MKFCDVCELRFFLRIWLWIVDMRS